MTPQQREALKQALDQHSLKMAVKDAAPEDVAALPQDFTIPSYNENNKPLYDNQLFPAVNSVEDLVARGYATPDGQVTENGQMALSLKKVGALNDDYTLNDTGKAMMASRQDLLKEENLPLYMKSKEIGLDDTSELSWGEVGTNFLDQLKEGGKNLIDLASFDTSSMTPEQQAEFQLKSQAAASGFAKAGVTLATGAAKIIGTGTIQALAEDEETQKTAKALLDQKVERVSDDINNTNTAEFIDALGEMSGVNLNLQEGREQAIALVGEEKAQEFERAGESAGGFAAMFNPYGPSMLTAKVAFGAAGKGLGAAFKPISRSLLQADAKAAEVLAKTKQLATLERQAAGLQLATQTAEKQAVLAENMAQKFSQAGFTDRANNALRLANQARTKGQEAAARLGGFTDEIATVSDDLAKATQSATVADKVLQMTQKASQVPYLPITLLGKSLEYTGRGMIGIDKGLASMASKVGADKVYNAMNKITTLSGLGGVGVASGLGPAAFIPAAIKATWSTAPFIKATGEYIGLMGKEAMKARGQIGFWKRMYEMPNKGPMHRAVSGLMDTATLGGRVTGAAGRVGKGLAASYPVDLAFEWVAEGGEMNPNVLKQAAVETLVFGGTGAALGGITMGSAERIRSLQNGDATNFYRSLTDPSQRVMFNGMAPDLKRAIGTFSASNPGAKIEFVTQGEGAYDRNTKTVMVNPTSRNPLKPLLTHEFMHHMLNNGIGDGVVAQLVGDGYQTGGILRSKDGGYEPQYEAFKNEYVNRLRQQHEKNIKLRDAIGDPVPKSEREFKVPDEKYLAEEYFIETNVDDMLGLVESGKLGKMAGRMVLNDKVRALGDAILNKSAILRDLHFRIGGVMDKQGKMVKGNGFLGGQLYQSPEIRRMFKKMVNESVGRRGGIDAAKMKARNGITLPISGKNDPILAELTSLWETDADGNALIDKNGDYIPLSKETDELRSQAGMLLVDDLRARQARGEVIEDGELAYNPDNNTWSGQYLTDRQIDLIALSGRFNNKQIQQLKLLNKAAKATSDPNADPATRGHRFSVIYQPALKKNRKGQWRYDQIEPQMRDIVPYGVEISKDGNILYRIMSTNQLFANVSEKATTKRGRSLYDGNMDAILRDANAVIDLHGKLQATDAYFKDKYGAQWASHKEFINSVFGNVGKGHKDINPLVASDRVDAVVKSYRLDRMNKATQLVGATQLPYQNNLIKINYLPEGEPILDANGEPKDLRYTPRIEDRPEQRQMPEVSPEDLNPVANKQEAQGLWADGKQMFAINEMDEKLTPITSKAMLDSYSADAIGWMEPEQAGQMRFMPEGVDEDKFYSQLDRVITDKVPSRATPQQIMATIDPTRGSGVKADEIKWSGIEQALASLEKDGKVSKEDLLNYLRNEGRVRFEEVDVGKAFTPQDLEKMRQEAEQSGDFSRYDEALLQNLHDGTKYAQYQLPGGENYREVVLAMQSKTGVSKEQAIKLRDEAWDEATKLEDFPADANPLYQTAWLRDNYPDQYAKWQDFSRAANLKDSKVNKNVYTSSHFPNIFNYVAHMRTNERVDADGRPGLFVEEFQSDRHQEGRKKGYASDRQSKEEVISTRNEIYRAYDAGEITLAERNQRLESLGAAGGVADAPFRTTWPLQLFKRALRDAVDSGKEWVGWTTGDTQAERFDLSKQIGKVVWNEDTKILTAYDPSQQRTVIQESNITADKLEDYVGKEVAKKLVDQSPDEDMDRSLAGLDLRVGGEGMKGFYDTMLPKEIGKYVKPFGGKVEKSEIKDLSELKKYVSSYSAWLEYIDPDGLTSPDEFYAMSEAERLAAVPEDGTTKPTPIWKVSITPEMRQLAQGQMRFMPEKDVDGDKGISPPIGSLGELRKNVEIKSSDLPINTKSVPKFVARTNKDDPWKVMDGPLRISKGNYLTPLPNIKVEKTKDFSVQNQDLVGNALSASQAPSNDPKEIKKQQVAAANVLDSLEKINSAIQDIENDPFKFVDTRGYAEIMKKSGVAGDVLIPPSSLRIMLNDPDYFAALLSGGYHGDKTVPGIRESAMSGLDAVVEMRDLIKGRPPELITALHHLWGTLSKQLPPLQQEALWMRMIVNKKVMDQIKASIDGTFNLTPDQWKNIVSSARTETVGTYGKLGENATSNANSFYLMLSKHNGRWNEVSDVYQNNDPVKMRYAFNTLGHGATGIKNKVQSFIGLTFGIKGNVLDRWRFVDMYLDDAMKLTGAKTPREYFKYEGKSKNVPVDKIGIYKNYGTIENNQSLFSLMLYSAMDRVSQIAIDSSPAMQKLLGNHADPGGLHWLSWNAIKNEAVGHSSLDITKNFIKKYASDGDFSKLTTDNFLEFVNKTEAFVEGTSGAGDEITRLTLKDGVFNYSKR